MTTQEQWKPIAGYVRYGISNHGSVRSLFSGRLLKPWRRKGYLLVMLSDTEGKHAVSVHRLVAAAFIGPCPDGKEVNHKDGIKSNNHWRNLEYMTSSENAIHAFRMGLRCSVPSYGEEHGSSKLTEENVHSIRRRIALGETQASIAASLGVTSSNISLIATGKGWAWLKEDSE